MIQEQQYYNQGTGPAMTSFVDARINTQRLMQKIERFLSAQRTVTETNEQQQVVETVYTYGKPYANPEGINAILSMIEMIVNDQTVQGNFTRDDYEDYIYYTRIELAEAIILNCYYWKVEDNKIDIIINRIMGLIIPFISRLIDNKERDSYNRITSHENVTQTISDKQREGGIMQGLGKAFGGGNK